MAAGRRTLGIDPGSHHLGWAVLAAERGRRPSHLASGVIDAPAGPLAERLAGQARQLEAVCGRWAPGDAAIESVFAGINARSALVLGQARGAVLVTLARHGLSIAEYTPGSVKRAVAAAGRADKAQVARMVALLLGLPGPLRVDQSDALAVAWCHAQGGGPLPMAAPG